MAKKPKCDFSGWATRFNLRCSDGRTIRPNAFKHHDGQTVPLVWNHDHKDPNQVLGHALLETRNEGVYAYCSFNETEQGKNAKELVQHGDITSLSIYANKLKQQGNNVIHGQIRELSLVLAGANPGAHIDVIAHSDEGDDDDLLVEIFNPSEELIIEHADNEEFIDEEPVEQPQKKEKKQNMANDKTVQEVFDEMTEEQKTVVYAIVGQAVEDALEDAGVELDEDGEPVKHNAFEDYDYDYEDDEEQCLTHAEFMEIAEDAQRIGSMREAFLQHGITDIDVLFPDHKAVNKTPELIQNNQDWVSKVMAAVKRTPFARIKSTAANITADEARAKGYTKGKKKLDEVFTVLKRTTDPTTVYKKQSIDRDDVLDIDSFDVVSFVKDEMRGKLNEELARAFLIGDGRLASAEDHINHTHIRPILGDDPLYTVPKILKRGVDEKGAPVSDEAFAKEFIKTVLKSNKEYKGSGNKMLFATVDLVTSMLLIEDANGRTIYESLDKLKKVLRVNDIVEVPVFDGVKRTNEESTKDFHLMAILVDLNDYNVGNDRGGEVTLFDDFDIDFNKQKYLIETRCSGALVKPYSAISFEEETAHSA